MGAQAGPSMSDVTPDEVAGEVRSVYVRGAITGIVGAVAVALWFLFIDFGRGHVLYTPTVLGTVLFGIREGLASPETVVPSARIALMFSLVHVAVFIAIGIAAVRLEDVFERRPNFLLAIVLLFLILGLGFLAFAMTFAALPLDLLSWPDVLFGNMWAAVAMATYLWRSRLRQPAQPAPVKKAGALPSHDVR